MSSATEAQIFEIVHANCGYQAEERDVWRETVADGVVAHDNASENKIKARQGDMKTKDQNKRLTYNLSVHQSASYTASWCVNEGHNSLPCPFS